jgi:hypothetical protein
VHTRLIAVLGLEAMSTVMRRSWAFYLAADASAQILGTANFCVRARFPPFSPHNVISNLHIVAPPMRGSHTGEHIYEVTIKVTGRFGRDLAVEIIGATSDGGANMVGSVSGWQTRQRNASTDPDSFYLVHCGRHQLNLMNGKAMASIEVEGSEWIRKLHEVVKLVKK